MIVFTCSGKNHPNETRSTKVSVSVCRSHRFHHFQFIAIVFAWHPLFCSALASHENGLLLLIPLLGPLRYFFFCRVSIYSFYSLKPPPTSCKQAALLRCGSSDFKTLEQRKCTDSQCLLCIFQRACFPCVCVTLGH